MHFCQHDEFIRVESVLEQNCVSQRCSCLGLRFDIGLEDGMATVRISFGMDDFQGSSLARLGAVEEIDSTWKTVVLLGIKASG